MLNSPKKRTKKFDFTTLIPQVDLFSFVFWEKLKTLKIHFKVNWPLVSNKLWGFQSYFCGLLRIYENMKYVKAIRNFWKSMSFQLPIWIICWHVLMMENPIITFRQRNVSYLEVESFCQDSTRTISCTFL